MKWVRIYALGNLDRISDKKTDLFWIKYGHMPEEDWKQDWEAEMYWVRKASVWSVRYREVSMWYDMFWKRALKQTTKVLKEDIGYLL